MFTITRSFLLLLLFLFVSGTMSSAYAQRQRGDDETEQEDVVNQYDPKYRPGAIPKSVEGLGVLPNSSYLLQFVQKPGAPENEANLRVTQSLAVGGCGSVASPDVDIQHNGISIWVTLTNPDVQLDESAYYSHNACKKDIGFVETDIPFNRDELIANGIKKIVLKTAGGSDSFDVTVDEHRLSLTPHSSTFFKTPKNAKSTDPLAHWFYPENTVVLFVPEAQKEDNFSADIIRLAQRQGMVEVKAFIPGFKHPLKDLNTVYVVDQTGALAKALEKRHHSHFGAVTATETFYGPDGPYEKPRKLDVLAKLPGLLE